MVEIKQLRPDDIWVHLNEEGILDKKKGALLHKKVHDFKFVKNSKLTIDLNGIYSINSEGFNELFNLMRTATENNITVYFANIHPDVDEMITVLTLTSEG
jgi:anti-anti-sigma regulatory factor